MIIDIDINEVEFNWTAVEWGSGQAEKRTPSRRFLAHVWTLSKCLEDVCDTIEYHHNLINERRVEEAKSRIAENVKNFPTWGERLANSDESYFMTEEDEPKVIDGAWALEKDTGHESDFVFNDSPSAYGQKELVDYRRANFAALERRWSTFRRKGVNLQSLKSDPSRSFYKAAKTEWELLEEARQEWAA